MTSNIQSVLFGNSWTQIEARKWLKENAFKSSNVNITKNELRYRQLPPNYFRQFRIKKIPKFDIELVIGFY